MLIIRLIILMQKFQHAHWLRSRQLILSSAESWNFLVQKSGNWAQKVEIKLIVSLRWVNRQLMYVFFFSVRMKNVQTDVNHKPCEHKANLILCFIHAVFWPKLQETAQKKQKPNSKMLNSWLTIKTWKMSWNKNNFHWMEKVVSLKCCEKSFLKPCFLVVSIFLSIK